MSQNDSATISSRMPRPAARTRNRIAGAIIIVLLVAATVTVSRAAWFHTQGWQFSLFPAAAPSRIVFEGRHYTRGSTQPDKLPASYVAKATTPGGGTIYQSDTDVGASVIVMVSDGTHVWAYGLEGGP